MGKIKTILAKHTRIGLDSNIIIYFLDNNEKYGAICREIFSNIEKRGNIGVTSGLSYLESAVPAMRAGDIPTLTMIKSFFLQMPGLKVAMPDYNILDKALYLRAVYNIKAIDAVQLATAIVNDCSLFITNDKNITKIKKIAFLYLDEAS
ncbi:PIN domain-containing protein [Candidatus Microgenomates bacterium]|nr:PIN domain-containing protein [Candidatus Microgenomates bacterium]